MLLTDAANRWCIYGATFKSRSCFRRAKELAESIGANAYQTDVRRQPARAFGGAVLP